MKFTCEKCGANRFAWIGRRGGTPSVEIQCACGHIQNIDFASADESREYFNNIDNYTTDQATPLREMVARINNEERG